MKANIKFPSILWIYGTAILCAVAVYLVPQLESNSDLTTLLESKSTDAEVYEEMLDQFGSDEAVIVAISGADIFNLDGLDIMMFAVQQLEESEYIETVSGLPTVYMNNFGGEDYEALIQEMTDTPFYHGLFINEDATVAGLLIEPKVFAPDESNVSVKDTRRNTIEAIEQAMEPLREFGYRIDLVGEPVMNVAVDRISTAEIRVFFPLAIIISLLVLLVLLRSFRAAFVVLICAVITQLLTVSLLVVAGIPLSVVTKSFPLILWVLSLASCIHLVARYQHFRKHTGTPREAVLVALEEVRYACYLSSITTACGFFSLISAIARPIQELGAIIGIGVVLAAVINMNIAPFLLVWLKTPGPRFSLGDSEKFFRGMTDHVIRWAIPIVMFFMMFVGLGLYSLTQVQVNQYTLKFLPKDSPTVDSYLYVAENLTGMYNMEIILSLPDTWLDEKYWPAITHITEELTKSEHIPRVITPLQFLKKMNQWDHDFDPEFYALPESTEAAEELYGLLEEEDKNSLNRMVSPDNKKIRMTVLVNSTYTPDFADIVKQSEALLEGLPEGMTGHVTGRIKRMRNLQDDLIQSQINSFSLAFFLIFIPILFGLRSLKLFGAAVVPNLMPILTTFGAMVVLGIGLDPGTVMVASIAMGIAVDDTIHTLAGYRRAIQLGHSNHEAIEETLANVGPAITVTTMTACIGFFILAFSAFSPLHNLGLLSGIAIVIALLGDIFFVPALLALIRQPGAPPVQMDGVPFAE